MQQPSLGEAGVEQPCKESPKGTPEGRRYDEGHKPIFFGLKLQIGKDKERDRGGKAQQEDQEKKADNPGEGQECPPPGRPLVRILRKFEVNHRLVVRFFPLPEILINTK